MLFASFDWNTFFDYLIFPLTSVTWHAMFLTVWIAVLAQSFGVLSRTHLGALPTCRDSGRCGSLSGVYVWFFRGTPLIVQMFFVYFGANLLSWLRPVPALRRASAYSPRSTARRSPAWSRSRVNEGAYMSEIIRAGIDSVDRGQMEAAHVGRHDARVSRCGGSSCRRRRGSSCRRSATSSTA